MHLWVNNELRYTGHYSHSPFVDPRRKVALYAIKTPHLAFASDPFYYACYNPATVLRCRMLAILLSGVMEDDEGTWRRLPIELVRCLLEELIFSSSMIFATRLGMSSRVRIAAVGALLASLNTCSCLF